MPIRSHLNGQRFDAETIRLMGLAFEMTLISLRLVHLGDISNNVIAEKLIDLAKSGETRSRTVVRSGVAAMGSSRSTHRSR
jgi:hypothetical protein